MQERGPWQRSAGLFHEVLRDVYAPESPDPSLQEAIHQRLGLLQQGGVPQSYDREYGRDTIWPATLVIDAAGIIRYTELSKHISDRPDPKVLLREIRSTLKT